MAEPASANDHDERLATLISVLVLGLTLAALAPPPTWEITLEMLGSELALRFSGPVQALILLVILVCVGVHSLARTSLPEPASEAPLSSGHEPSLATSAMLWPLPTLVAILGLVAVESVIWWGYQVAMALVVGAVMAAVIALQLHTQSLSTAPRRGFRLALNGVAYVIAFLLFSSIFGTRQRSVLTATAVLAVSASLALELLRNAHTSVWRPWLYAAVIGLAMGEMTWALNYTRLADRTGGALLLLLFYIVTGMTQQHLWDRLSQRVVAEYIAVLALGLAVIAFLL